MSESDTNRQFTSKSKRLADLVAAHRRTLKRADVGPPDCRRITLGEYLMLSLPTIRTRGAIS